MPLNSPIKKKNIWKHAARLSEYALKPNGQCQHLWSTDRVWILRNISQITTAMKNPMPVLEMAPSSKMWMVTRVWRGEAPANRFVDQCLQLVTELQGGVGSEGSVEVPVVTLSRLLSNPGDKVYTFWASW